MAAVIQKGETTAARRRVDLEVESSTDGSKAPRKTSFAAYLYISVSTYLYQAAVGTLTNKRRPLSYTPAAFTADSTTDEATQTAHGLETGDGPFTVSNIGGALPGGLVAATNYWIVNPATGDTGGNLFQFATSLANAYAGTVVDITSNGTGTQTLTAATGCSRGIDGQWNYELAAAELVADGCEIGVAILGHATYEAYSTINYVATGASIWTEDSGDGGLNRGEQLNLVTRTAAAKFSKIGNDIQYRDMADTKDSHHGTVTTSGRVDAGIDDAS